MAIDWKPTSQWWYGRFTESGRKTLVNLGIKIAGRRPISINATGPDVDPRFVESRGRAIEAHDRVRDEVRSRSNQLEVQQKIIALKTGGRLETVELRDLADRWKMIPRSRELDDSYCKQSKKHLARFVAFVKERWPRVSELSDVTRDHVAAFMDAEAKRGIAARTWNRVLILLRTVFRQFQPEADAYRRYLVTTPVKESDSIHRKPFTPEELKAILQVARDDEFTRPLIVTAMCTAMRRGDVCLLRWQAVDLEHGFMTVKTAKTGQTVSIPIFPLLADELRKRPKDGSEYVFPQQAAMYLENPDGITWRVKKILAIALHKIGSDSSRPPELSPEETRKMGHAYIESLGGSKKAIRMRAVFDDYLAGRMRHREILAAHKISRATLSNHLSQIEGKIGCRVIRGRHQGPSIAELLSSGQSVLNAEREHGINRASLRDFHSFRVTWVTLALSANVPIELVRKVTGHKTVEVVITHYFQPGRENFRQALQSAMPQLLMNGEKTRDQKIRDIVEVMSAKTINRDRVQLLALLDGTQ